MASHVGKIPQGFIKVLNISFCLLCCFIFSLKTNFAGVLKCPDVVILLCMSFSLFWIFSTFLSFVCLFVFSVLFCLFLKKLCWQALTGQSCVECFFLFSWCFCIIRIVCIFCLFSPSSQPKILQAGVQKCPDVILQSCYGRKVGLKTSYRKACCYLIQRLRKGALKSAKERPQLFIQQKS